MDESGVVSGVPGSVLVGGLTAPDAGKISRIAPGGTVSDLFGPSGLYNNPNCFAFDAFETLFYANGDLVATTAGLTGSLANDDPLVIGSWYRSGAEEGRTPVHHSAPISHAPIPRLTGP
ncbi:MAG: hypothetical protein MUF04_01015 [Akkermansiaceae bacterium]|nr:hypothetical protein [Akkermansiaceae bacterium]